MLTKEMHAALPRVFESVQVLLLVFFHCQVPLRWISPLPFSLGPLFQSRFRIKCYS